VRSKAGKSQLNLPHGTKTEPDMQKRWAAGVRCVSLGERVRTYGGKDF